MYFDLDGLPMCTDCWSALFRNPEAKRVAETLLADGTIWISTVWLGLDHSLTLDGLPIIFETMVFGGAMDQEDCWRYSTREQALAGHQEVVRLVELDLAITSAEDRADD